MGLFGSKTPKEPDELVAERIRNSECGQVFAENFVQFFQVGSEYVNWLMANSKERSFEMKFFKDGVLLERIEVSRRQLKEHDTYTVDSEGWGFGASGYEDLPSNQYVSQFNSYIWKRIESECPAVTVSLGVSSGSIRIALAPTAKKGW